MNPISKIGISLLALAICISCTKQQNNANANNDWLNNTNTTTTNNNNNTHYNTVPDNSIMAKVDGKSWVGQVPIGKFSEGTVFVAAKNTDGSSIDLYFPGNIQPGTYTLGATGSTYVAVYNPSAGGSFVSSRGTLNIIRRDVQNKQIEGSFNFNADPTVVTDGGFKLNYQ